MESKFVEAQGVRIRWEESGEGSPVVFVPRYTHLAAPMAARETQSHVQKWR